MIDSEESGYHGTGELLFTTALHSSLSAISDYLLYEVGFILLSFMHVRLSFNHLMSFILSKYFCGVLKLNFCTSDAL